MTKTMVFALGLTVAFGISQVRAEAPKAEEKKKDAGGAPAGAAPSMPAAAKPGPETAALKPFSINTGWTGVMKADAMGPGSPEMPTKGKQKCAWLTGGLWVTCDVEDGPAAPKSFVWKGHWILGWDVQAKEYRGAIFDNMGTSTTMRGKMDGSKLILESPEQVMMGQPVKLRLTWDATDPKAIKFVEERSVKGSPWIVSMESTYKPGK